MRETFDDEAETLELSRDVIADAILRGLERPKPNVFLTPPLAGGPPSPWARTRMPQKHIPTVVLPKRRSPVRQASAKTKHGSKLHWAVFAMAAAIAVGLWRDPPARADAEAHLRDAGRQVAAKLSPLALSALRAR